MKRYLVESEDSPAFLCMAEDRSHAVEQFKNAYPEVESGIIVSSLSRENPTYNHMYTLCFAVSGSKCPKGTDIDPEQFAKAIAERVDELYATGSWDEALGFPDDSYEE